MLVVAPDSFKGTLAAADVADSLARGARTGAPHERVQTLPLADGGEGTADAFRGSVGGVWVEAPTEDPWGRSIRAAYLRIEGGLQGLPGPVAVIDWASAGGFVEDRTPVQALAADSGGLGRMMLHALQRGCASLVVGLGGSATTDGAAGLLRELGAAVVDDEGRALPPGGAALARAARVDLTGLPRVPIIALTDVDSPLLGPTGTVARFAPQKGADPPSRPLLDRGLERWAALLDPRRRHWTAAGAGAAGGAGFGLAAALDARLVPGAAAVADLVGLDDLLATATRVWTGEGRLDGTTPGGKVPGEVARRSQAPVDLIGGDLGADARALDTLGPATVITLVDPPTAAPPTAWCSLGLRRGRAAAMEDPAGALEEVGRALARRTLRTRPRGAGG